MLLLASLGSALFPMPLCLPVSTAEKDRSKPFPCQNRPCGCRSAEQCKKKCCCFSNSQKTAWAKRNGVDVTTVVDLAKKETKPNRSACCSSPGAKKSAPLSAQTSRRIPTTTKGASAGHQVVLRVMAQECQGVEVTFAGQPIFVLPQSFALDALVEPICERLMLTGSRLPQAVSEPPVPPPRLAAV